MVLETPLHSHKMGNAAILPYCLTEPECIKKAWMDNCAVKGGGQPLCSRQAPRVRPQTGRGECAPGRKASCSELLEIWYGLGYPMYGCGRERVGLLVSWQHLQPKSSGSHTPRTTDTHTHTYSHTHLHTIKCSLRSSRTPPPHVVSDACPSDITHDTNTCLITHMPTHTPLHTPLSTSTRANTRSHTFTQVHTSSQTLTIKSQRFHTPWQTLTVFFYIHIHIHIYMYIDIYIYIHIHIHIYNDIYIYIYSRIYIHLYIHIHIHIHTTFTFTFTFTFIFTFTFTLLYITLLYLFLVTFLPCLPFFCRF